MTPAELKDLYDRRRRVLARRPGFGRASAAAHVRLDAAAEAVCEVLQGERALAVHFAPEDAGADSGLHPDELMRASLGACLALGYRLWGARLGVDIGGVDIDVTCEYDARGPLGLDDGVPAGWQRVVLDVRIASHAPEADVRRVVETANRLSPMLGNLAPTVQRAFRVSVRRPGA